MTLDKEPIVFQVPEFGDRFWVYAHYDASHRRAFRDRQTQYGTKPGFYMMVGPNWNGENASRRLRRWCAPLRRWSLPFRASLLMTARRIKKAVQPVISQVAYYPLSVSSTAQ